MEVLTAIFAGCAIIALAGWYGSWKHSRFMKAEADYWHENYQIMLEEFAKLKAEAGS